MSTYGAMIDRIADELKRSDLTSQIRLAIKSAIQNYENETFYFNETRQTIDTVDGKEYYGLPTNFQGLNTLTLTTNSYTYLLQPRTFEWIEEHQTNDNYKSRPTDWAIFAQQLRLFPIPNDSYRIEMSGIKRFDELSATSDTNAFMVDGEEVIRYRAKKDVLINIIQGPESIQAAQAMSMMEQDSLTRLREETTKRRTSNTLRYFRF